MPHWLQSLILGIVQGVTEFVPVSSSGHLVLLPYLAGWDEPGLAFDVALHMGTAAAVIVFFRSELVGMAKAVVRPGGGAESALYRRLLVLLAIGTVPAAIAGVTLESFFQETFKSPLVVSSFLLVTALVLTAGERFRARRIALAKVRADAAPKPQQVWTGDWMGEVSDETAVDPLANVDIGRDAGDVSGTDLRGLQLRHALVVGVGQAFALFPGLSRSGATITAGMFSGLTRAAATRFSFLLSLPALVGAAVVSLPDLGEQTSAYSGGDLAVGVIAAFVAGYATVAWLIRLLARERLTVFVRYLIAASAIGFLGYAMNGPVSSV
jgi:undecaprenyl-diphosphatase